MRSIIDRIIETKSVGENDLRHLASWLSGRDKSHEKAIVSRWAETLVADMESDEEASLTRHALLGKQVVSQYALWQRGHTGSIGLVTKAPDDDDAISRLLFILAADISAFARKLQAIFSVQAKVALEVLSRTRFPLSVIEIFREPEFRSELIDTTEEFYRLVIRHGADNGVSRLPVAARERIPLLPNDRLITEPDPTPPDTPPPAPPDAPGLPGDDPFSNLPEVSVDFDFVNDEVSKFIEEESVRVVDRVGETVEIELEKVIGDSVQSGDSVTETADKIRRKLEGDGETKGIVEERAIVVARTETARAYVAGEEAAWKKSGVVTHKKWLLAPDPCEFCLAVAKEFNEKGGVPIGEPFYPKGHLLKGARGGLMRLNYDDVFGPPLHPNCRCDLIAVLRE